MLVKARDSDSFGWEPEMIQDSETGLLYPVGDIPALADRIERLMKDPGLRARLGESGFRFVNTQFSEERFYDASAKLCAVCRNGKSHGTRS